MPLEFIPNRERAFRLFDGLLELWKAKAHPFNHPDAVVPQTLIGSKLRGDKPALVNFYTYVCFYMKGRIESAQAFRSMLRMHEARPDLFDPIQAMWVSVEEVEKVLQDFMKIDARSTAPQWVENARRLVRNWDGQAINIYRGVDNFDEMMRRLRNKRESKKALREAFLVDDRGEGLQGHQPKMVSMGTYFVDWEGLLKPRFIYSPPTDFQNYRLGFTSESVVPADPEAVRFRVTERLSKVWRELTMEYLEERGVDPLDLADTLWLYSGRMCGNSPVTAIQEPRLDKNGRGMFGIGELPNTKTVPTFMPRHRRQLEKTCLSCWLLHNNMCKYAIPSKPHYGTKNDGEDYGGMIWLTPRPRVEDHWTALRGQPEYPEPVEPVEVPKLFEDDS